MRRPTYYLWKNEFQTQEEFENTKSNYQKLGFRVVTFLDGRADKDIHEGLRAVIINHYKK